MKITNVGILPTQSANAAGRPALTPELLAATGARYSRNNEGLAAILSKIDFGNELEILNKFLNVFEGAGDPGDVASTCQHLINNYRKPNFDKGVDAIFKMFDYGHASVADMSPVALFIDDISIYDAYYLWSISPQAGGQESSTRYLKIDEESLASACDLGISEADSGGWGKDMLQAFSAYQQALVFWEKVAADYPELTRIPKSLIDDPSEKAQKQVARMLRNFAFDRARVFLPVAAKTNVMMIQSARAWVGVIQLLLSHLHPSLNALGEALKVELALSAPRLIRHAREDSAAKAVLARKLTRSSEKARRASYPFHEAYPDSTLIIPMYTADEEYFLEDIQDRTNRYSVFGDYISAMPVTYGWRAIAMAEMRDMNRHRTGSKCTTLCPVGFHAAEDQIPEGVTPAERAVYAKLVDIGRALSEKATRLLAAGDPTYIYHTLLGTQYDFMHTTTADKVIYTMELRTGVGGHYRYAGHCREILAKWYQHFPSHQGVIFEGSAEPE